MGFIDPIFGGVRSKLKMSIQRDFAHNLNFQLIFNHLSHTTTTTTLELISAEERAPRSIIKIGFSSTFLTDHINTNTWAYLDW